MAKGRISAYGVRSGKKNLESLPMNIRLEWQLRVSLKMMTFMCMLNSESAAIFRSRFNDLTVLFHIGFGDAVGFGPANAIREPRKHDIFRVCISLSFSLGGVHCTASYTFLFIFIII
jgi:hypothetical protein